MTSDNAPLLRPSPQGFCNSLRCLLQRERTILVALLWTACWSLTGNLGQARDLHVGIDPEVPSIAHAVKLAQPGDTIHLEPKVYRDYAGFYGKHGEPDRPIVLDGHGATLEGSDPLKPEQWKEIAPGLFAATDLLPRFDEAMLARWFFLFDGRMQLMGRTSKGKKAALKDPEDLAPGEWTFIKDPSREQPPSAQIFGTFYIRLAANQTWEQANVAVPVRSAGVQFGGLNSYLVIRNVTATHPYNDGFNIHGDCRNIVFENIRAIECGDDGISAHESAQYRVDGFVSIGNSTGICDTGTSETSYRNVYIANCVGFDLFFLDQGRYSIENAMVISSAQNPLTITGRTEGDCHVSLRNVWFRRQRKPNFGTVASRAHLQAANCTFEAMEVRTTGTAEWTNCVINGVPSEVGATGADRAALAHLIPEVPQQ